MAEISRTIGTVTITRHYEGEWSIETTWGGWAIHLHALQAARVATDWYDVPKDEARQAVAEIMAQARRSPALTPAGV
jgi:hypothetical protein